MECKWFLLYVLQNDDMRDLKLGVFEGVFGGAESKSHVLNLDGIF